MAISCSPGISPEQLLRKDDEMWICSILDLIPRSVYGEDSILADSMQPSEGKFQKKDKLRPHHKKARASKHQTRESRDESDSRRAGLKDKLQAKILEKRVERKADDQSYMEARASRKRKRDEKASSASEGRKRMRRDSMQSERKKGKVTTAKVENSDMDGPNKRKDGGEDEAANSLALETTRLSGFDANKSTKKIKRRKLRGSKLVELQKKLAEVNKEDELRRSGSETTAVRKQPMDTKASGLSDPNETVLRNREMEKAMQRVQGVQVKDDAKKLKKSIRKERRKTEKSREEWKKRRNAQEMEQQTKQEKRARNLEERKTKKASTSKNGRSVGKRK